MNPIETNELKKNSKTSNVLFFCFLIVLISVISNFVVKKFTKPFDEATGILELNTQNDYERVKKENEKLLKNIQLLKDTNSIAESNLGILVDQLAVLRSSNSLLTKIIKNKEKEIEMLREDVSTKNDTIYDFENKIKHPPPTNLSSQLNDFDKDITLPNNILSLNSENIFTQATFKKFIKPEYPKSLLREGKAGFIKLKLNIDKFGNIEEFSVLELSHKDFKNAVRKVVYDWEFNPAKQNGEPVKSVLIFPIEFK